MTVWDARYVYVVTSTWGELEEGISPGDCILKDDNQQEHFLYRRGDAGFRAVRTGEFEIYPMEEENEEGVER